MMSVKNEHYNQVANVLWIVLILNWLVAGAKIAAGMFYDSASMTADGFHSLSDGMSNIIGLIGIRFCLPIKDDCHPYGHKKYETLFSLGIAAMLIMVAINLGKQGITRILHPVTPQVDFISFVVMVITIIVNVSVMVYEYRKGKQLQSDILVVDSMHTRADIFTSFSVIIALIGVKIGFPIIDPIVTFVIAVFIAYAAFEIIKEQSRVLCDAAAITDLDKIKKIVLAIDGVKNCHKIRSRGRLDDVFLDLHVQMDAKVPLGKAHEISHSIQKEISQNFPNIVDVMVHMEPVIEEE
ncbi:MAG: cation diffusion facilitator family transporter [Elusimicrobiota bacterium]